MADRRYVVTGAANGIGLSVAQMAAASGDHVCLVDIDEKRLADAGASLRADGAQVTTIVADLTDPAAPATVIEQSVAAMGGIDVLVSNAGGPVFYDMKDLPVEGFDRAYALNVRATWLLAKAAYPFLAESCGNIVATASICGHHAAPPQGAYSVAKAGLLMLMKQLALEWGPAGIRCNSVSPGPTTTGLTEGVFNDVSDPKQRAIRERRESVLPLRRIGSPDNVAAAIMFLASPVAAQITGIDILVDGGMSVVLMAAGGVADGRTSG